jgi:hypothetical protein
MNTVKKKTQVLSRAFFRDRVAPGLAILLLQSFFTWSIATAWGKVTKFQKAYYLTQHEAHHAQVSSNRNGVKADSLARITTGLQAEIDSMKLKAFYNSQK